MKWLGWVFHVEPWSSYLGAMCESKDPHIPGRRVHPEEPGSGEFHVKHLVGDPFGLHCLQLPAVGGTFW
jgi:hypothetical protein